MQSYLWAITTFNQTHMTMYTPHELYKMGFEIWSVMARRLDPASKNI